MPNVKETYSLTAFEITFPCSNWHDSGKFSKLPSFSSFQNIVNQKASWNFDIAS